MGYHISIVRTAAGQARPISNDELVKALPSMNGRLVIDPARAGATQVVAPALGEDSPLLLLEDGELWSSTPGEVFIGLMIELANLLGARVRGDELETYRTLDEVYNYPDDEPLRRAAASARPRQSALTREAARSNFASTGIYIFEPQVLDLIPADTAFDIGSDLFPLLVERGLPFYAQKRAYDWIDIGSVTDYWSVLQSVMLGEVAQLDLPGVQISDGLWVGLNTRIDWEGTSIEGPVYIGSGSHIEAGCRIVGPSWIGHGSHLCAGAEVVRSVLFEYTRISAGASIDEKIVFKDYSVDRDGGMAHVSEFECSEWGNARDRRAWPRAGMADAVKAA